MCGIFAYTGMETDAAEKILEGLKVLEYRGYDSWGIAIVHDEGIKIQKNVGKIGDAKTNLPSSTIGIGHTRWATHGGVTIENAHPHLDQTGRIAVVHNGIIENYHDLKLKLIKKGHAFSSETDTEIVAHLIQEELLKKDDLKSALMNTFKQIIGSNAICMLDKKTDSIGVCRNGSPIVIGKSKKATIVGSDVTALLKYTKKIVYLEDGQGAVINDISLEIFRLSNGKTVITKETTIDWEVEDAQKEKFPHFLIKEIYEQKEAIQKSITSNTGRFGPVASKIREGYKVVLIGCGTASNCALAAKYFFAKNNIQAESYGGYEFAPFKHFINKKTVVIAISQSGETADTIIAVKEAKRRGALITALVNARGSTLERIADITLPINAGPEIAVVSTKAFTGQLALLYLLAYSVNGQEKIAMKNLEKLSISLTQWLNKDLETHIISVAKGLMDKEHIYIIGKHLNYPAAMEASLKIKEVSYIHSEHFAAGELKHGVIALIENGTPCICLSSEDEVKHELLSSAAELKARGGRIIGIAPYDSGEFDISIKTPNVGELTIFPNIIAAQLLAYYLAVGKGNDVDKPRNLAKSVTVK